MCQTTGLLPFGSWEYSVEDASLDVLGHIFNDVPEVIGCFMLFSIKHAHPDDPTRAAQTLTRDLLADPETMHNARPVKPLHPASMGLQCLPSLPSWRKLLMLSLSFSSCRFELEVEPLHKTGCRCGDSAVTCSDVVSLPAAVGFPHCCSCLESVLGEPSPRAQQTNWWSWSRRRCGHAEFRKLIGSLKTLLSVEHNGLKGEEAVQIVP